VDSQSQKYKFGEFVLDPAKRSLLLNGASIRLERKAFNVLCLLVEKAGICLSEQQILDEAWGSDTFVEEGNVAVAVRKIRKELGDLVRPYSFIDHEKKKGYTFIYQVEPVGPEAVNEHRGIDSLNFYSLKQKQTNYRRWTNESGSEEIVKIGWCWPAFFFGGLWGLAKRMGLIGACMLLGSSLIGYSVASVESDDDLSLFGIATSIAVGLFFGAYGNSWREWHLRRRGFSPIGTFTYSPVKVFLTDLFVKSKAVWNRSVWIKVFAGMLLLAVGSGIYYWRSNLPRTQVGCGSARLFAHIETNDVKTSVWFEWGDTPDLGSLTMKQSFAENNYYYQDLINLEKDTKYFYRAMASNMIDKSVGRVEWFVPNRCPSE